MTKKLLIFTGIAATVLLLALFPSCKSCNKTDNSTQTVVDTAKTTVPAPVNNINLPHADTTVIPVLSAVLDEAFEASSKKDLTKLGNLMIYRGPDENRFGQDVFNAKNKDERNVVRITADVFNKWNSGIDARQNARVFELDQPNGTKMEVMEVMFLGKKKINRVFFGFYPINGQYKIVDVTTHLE